MLIPFSECQQILNSHNIKIRGIFHIGAHHCEELKMYKDGGIDDSHIHWVEANPKLVMENKLRGIDNIYCFAADNSNGKASFNIANNGQSSSLLDFGTHKESYPWCQFIETITVDKKRVVDFARESGINFKDLNFWNLDIQGSELNALKSAEHLLDDIDAIYSEVNTQYVYEKCGLLSEMDEYLTGKGFTRVKAVMTNEGWGDALWVRLSAA